jgi:hypothetical protein
MFPNSYLRDIHEHGLEYKTKVPSPAEIVIKQSRPYRMKRPQDQAEFFVLLSKLLYYIVTGKSNIGFLANENWNPFADSTKHKPQVCQIV